MTYRADLYKQLKATGTKIEKPFVKWTTEELILTLRNLDVEPLSPPEQPVLAKPDPVEDPLPNPGPVDWEALAALREQQEAAEQVNVEAQPAAEEWQPTPADPNEMPGQRLNIKDEGEIIRMDEQGRYWLQEEVRKPAYPKPRGRRVLKYMDSGVRTETVQAGEYLESFEVAGDEAQRPGEIKITLPSYQVGIYRVKQYPFKIYCYNGKEGFDYKEICEYYGSTELVPETCKRTYVSNVLCFDIRSVIRTIQAEYRHLQLIGKVK